MRLSLFCALALVMSYGSSSRAQTPEEPRLTIAHLKLETAPHHPPNLLATSLRPRTALERAHYVKQRRARMLLGVGVGLVASSLIHALWAVQLSNCRHMGTKQLPSVDAAAVLGGIGAAFTFGGGLSLVRSRRVVTYLPSPTQNAAVIGLGMGVGLTTQAALAGLWSVVEAGCSY